MTIIYPGTEAPDLTVPTVSGDQFSLSASQPEKFTIVVFYRGNHCPLCKNYLKEIEEAYPKAKKQGMEVIAISMDTLDKAKTTISEVSQASVDEKKEQDDAKSLLELPIGYGLTEEQAREWGLYISSARPGTTEPDVFSEPALFVIRPDKTVYMAQVQNVPFTRPNFEQLLWGLQYVLENKYPIRGDLTKQ